ncbi:MAG: hypothetical protein OXG98_08745 [Gemmatimonadetes bacterium]|nr:hypothetical protein [Gemmatimonadota bacterium]
MVLAGQFDVAAGMGFGVFPEFGPAAALRKIGINKAGHHGPEVLHVFHVMTGEIREEVSDFHDTVVQVAVDETDWRCGY